MFTGRYFIPLGVIVILIIAALACARPGSERIIEVSATPPANALLFTPTPNGPTPEPIRPTPNPVRFPMQVNDDGSYAVQPGDTLAMIAARFAVSLDSLVALNNITNPNQLEVGQTLQIPSVRAEPGTSFKIIPDSELVYGPTTVGFDVADYMKQKGGFLRNYSEEVNGQLLSGVEIVSAIALEYSVNPRLLLALLEYRSGWITNLGPNAEQISYPLGYIDPNRQGLYRQVATAADLLNEGYYGWRYRGLEATILTADSSTMAFAPDLNAGTVAVQFYFAKISSRPQWEFDVSEQGLFQIYLALFGDPFRNAVEPLIPSDLAQPALQFPFPAGETWYYTGGPHGGFASGSAWAAVDFAPPSPPEELLIEQGICYVSPASVAAVADGVIARSGGGYVVLDLDGDGNEQTGWSIVYLHISSNGVVPAGTRVQTGDLLGNPSCEGGVSSATHLHISRRYNGEWIPADCQRCPGDLQVPPFILNEWRVFLTTGEYQGTMQHIKSGEVRQALQGRINTNNHLSY
jgi:LasA protease